jgi:hypothetical protein
MDAFFLLFANPLVIFILTLYEKGSVSVVVNTAWSDLVGTIALSHYPHSRQSPPSHQQNLESKLRRSPSPSPLLPPQNAIISCSNPSFVLLRDGQRNLTGGRGKGEIHARR